MWGSLLAWFAWLPGPGQVDRPDLLVVCLDDVSDQDLAAASTPCIDRLAREGLVVENFYAMPVCSPTRYALQFGRWPRRSNVGTGIDTFRLPAANNPVPPRRLPSVARTLKALGYRTALVGKWHLGQVDLEGELTGRISLAPHLWGYDDWLAGTPTNPGHGGGHGYRDWVRVDNGTVLRNENEHATRVQMRTALAWWEETPSPKFLFLNFNAAHAPFQPEDSTGVQGARAKFLRLIAEADAALDQLLMQVDRHKSYVFLISDNGTPNGAVEAGEDPVRAKHSTYERGVNTPCLVAGPDIRPRGRLRTPVSCVDLPATLVELAGGRELFEDGVSFAAGLRRPNGWSNPERPWVFSEYFRTSLPGPADMFLDDRMVRLEHWKLRRFVDPVQGQVDRFYDLEGDPGEAQALSDSQVPEGIAERLRGILDTLPPRGSDFATGAVPLRPKPR